METVFLNLFFFLKDSLDYGLGIGLDMEKEDMGKKEWVLKALSKRSSKRQQTWWNRENETDSPKQVTERAIQRKKVLLNIMYAPQFISSNSIYLSMLLYLDVGI